MIAEKSSDVKVKRVSRLTESKARCCISHDFGGFYQIIPCIRPAVVRIKGAHGCPATIRFFVLGRAVQTWQEAERVLEWYKLRWRIEDWHRVLKSGYKVEYLGHRQGERIERAVTINAVIAWRLTLMTLLGRDTPELPADTLFTEIELAALEDFVQDRRQLPPDNLGRAVLTLAMLGGYLNYKRKQYAVPGHKVM